MAGAETEIFDQIGREQGCRRLSKAFYALVAKDQTLKPLFPGKSLRCASEEFAAFLIQFFDGDPKQTHYRWWISLRESHARFNITESQRSAWIALMKLALHETVPDKRACERLADFFVHVSHYLLGRDVPPLNNPELAERWKDQEALDHLVKELAKGCDTEAIRVADKLTHRKNVFVSILAKMITTDRVALIDYASESINRDRELCKYSFNGLTLLHLAAGSGSVAFVKTLLRAGMDPNVLDAGGHAPLFRAAGRDRLDAGGAVVRTLVAAGAHLNHGGGVARSTALHQAARFGNVCVAATLIELGADTNAKDSRGLTPLDRAVNCRRHEVAALLRNA